MPTSSSPKGPVIGNRSNNTKYPKGFVQPLLSQVKLSPKHKAEVEKALVKAGISSKGSPSWQQSINNRGVKLGPIGAIPANSVSTAGRGDAKDSIKSVYGGAGLTPEFIKDQAAAQATRDAKKILNTLASGSGSSSGSTSSKKKKSSSSGTASAQAAPAGPSVTDLINNLYDTLLQEVGNQQTSTAGEYDATKQGITDQYKKAQQDLYQKYQATGNQLAQQAANLGVDYGNSSINATQDAALKRLQETGDLSLASDQSYLDKMKLMQEGAFGALKTGALQSKADAQLAYQMYLANLAAAKKSGGGGGSRKGGGGGSGSSGVKGSATETSTSVDTGINAAIADLIAKGDYEGAAYAQNAYDSSQGGALGKAAGDASFSPGYVPPVDKSHKFLGVLPSVIKRTSAQAKNKKGTNLANLAKKVIPNLRQLSDSGYGSPKITSTVKYTGKP